MRSERKKQIHLHFSEPQGRKAHAVGLKRKGGTDARSKSRGCLQTMPCKKEEKPAKQD